MPMEQVGMQAGKMFAKWLKDRKTKKKAKGLEKGAIKAVLKKKTRTNIQKRQDALKEAYDN